METENNELSAEEKRLKSLISLGILDSLPESQFDDITFLASQICQTPIALISLIDQERQWFKSKVGLEASSTPREYAFCAHSILQSEVFVVADPTKDERFKNNPLVTGHPNIRFYAGAPLLSPDGQAIGTVCVIDKIPRDLTSSQIESLKALSRQVTKLLESKIIIETLKTSERNFLFRKTATENIVEGVVLQDASGNIIDFNPAALEVLSLSADQLLGKTSFDPNWRSIREDGSDFPGHEHPAMVCLKTNKKQPTTIMGIQVPPKQIRWLKINSVPMFENGGDIATHAVSSFSDITELKNAYEERKIIEAQLAESARLSALGEMSAGVAHEINNPLAIIQGKISVIKLRVRNRDEDYEAWFKELEIIEATIDRIAKIASALKNYSRSEESDPFEKVHIKNIILEAVDLCKNRSEKAKIQIEVSCSPDLRIDCRPNQIAQILLNLISNSIDALENLSDKFIKIIVSENTDHISIHFRDSGKGIDPVIAAKIMNPFYTTKAPGKGTGMGLGISKGLAKKHGGDLVYLLPEKQTTFLLTLQKNHLN